MVESEYIAIVFSILNRKPKIISYRLIYYFVFCCCIVISHQRFSPFPSTSVGGGGYWFCLHSSHRIKYTICVYLSWAFLYIIPWLRLSGISNVYLLIFMIPCNCKLNFFFNKSFNKLFKNYLKDKILNLILGLSHLNSFRTLYLNPCMTQL